MLFKQKGYDEFLAQQIKEAKEDIANNRVLTLEQSKARTAQMIARKAQELAQAESEMVAYG